MMLVLYFPISMKKLDPFYWYMILAHRQLLKAHLHAEEKIFVFTNINKHRTAQWINLFAAVIIFFALRSVPRADMGSVISALLAPVMVMGGAWFSLSFGAIPARLIDCSMSVTLWMYTGFKVSLTTMFLALGFITPPLLWIVFAVIYLAMDLSSTVYDTADGLKAGLDEAVLKHSRAALIYYNSQGIRVEDENSSS